MNNTPIPFGKTVAAFTSFLLAGSSLSPGAGLITSGFPDDLPGHVLLWETDFTTRDGWGNVSPTSRGQIDEDAGLLFTQSDGIAGPFATLANAAVLGERLDLEVGEVTTTVLYFNGRFDGDASTDTLWVRFRAGNPRGPMPNIAVGIRGDGTMLALGMGSQERLLTSGDHVSAANRDVAGVNVSLGEDFQQYRLVMIANLQSGNLTLRFDQFTDNGAGWDEVDSIDIPDYKSLLGEGEPHSFLDQLSVFFRTTGEAVSDLAITRRATGVPLEKPFFLPLGTAGGREPGDELETVGDGWQLSAEALRLTAASTSYQNELATAEVVNVEPGDGFALRNRVTLTSLNPATSETAVVQVLMAPASGFNPAGNDFYTAQWRPFVPGGGALEIREGLTGSIAAQIPWTGLAPSAGDPAAGIGSTFVMETRGVAGFSGEIELTFRLSDENGHTVSVGATVFPSQVGNRFGFGARHRAAEEAVWDFQDFGMTRPELLDFEPMEAPFAMEFGTAPERDGVEGLLANHPRPEDWNLRWDALEFERNDGNFETSSTSAVVANIVPGQDFTLEAEFTPQFLSGGNLNRVGFLVLGRAHEPFEAPFDPAVDPLYYSLQWMPRQSNEESSLRIRRGFNGSNLPGSPTVVWEGLHPNETDPWSGLGQVYHMKAEGVYDAAGGLELTFTLTDSGGHSQTVTAGIPEPIEGNVFGIGGRMRANELPLFAFHNFSMELGEAPSTDGFDAWRALHFTTSQLTDPGVSGPLAAPAGDGTANLLKYAAGLPAWASVAPGSLAVASVAEGELRLAYSELRGAPDLEFLVEVSSDLIHWTAGGEHVGEVSRESNGDVDHVVVRSLAPMAEKGFIRLTIRRP